MGPVGAFTASWWGQCGLSLLVGGAGAAACAGKAGAPPNFPETAPGIAAHNTSHTPDDPKGVGGYIYERSSIEVLSKFCRSCVKVSSKFPCIGIVLGSVYDRPGIVLGTSSFVLSPLPAPHFYRQMPGPRYVQREGEGKTFIDRERERERSELRKVALLT